MKIVIGGNGIIGMFTAFRVLQKIPDASVVLIGPSSRTGSATLAAAAMLASFGEIEANVISNEVLITRQRFNQSATSLWPDIIAELTSESGEGIDYGMGTTVINSTSANILDDINFEAIGKWLHLENEEHYFIDPKEIVGYRPSPRFRALRAIHMPNEGWIDPSDLVAALNSYLKKSNRCQILDSSLKRMIHDDNQVLGFELESGESISGDTYLLCPGASIQSIVDCSNLPFQMPRILYGVGVTITVRPQSDSIINCLRTPNRGLACGIYSVPRSNGDVVFGATSAVWDSERLHPTLNNVHTLVQNCRREVDTFLDRAEFVTSRLGWRPVSEDTLPLLGETPFQNLIVADGMRRDGLHCSPLIADIFVALISKVVLPFDISDYRPDRTLTSILSYEEGIRQGVDSMVSALYQHDFEAGHQNTIDSLTSYFHHKVERIHEDNGYQDSGIPPELLSYYEFKSKNN